MIDKVIKLKDGRNFGYAEYGVPNGTPVLFFHGTPKKKEVTQSILSHP